MRRALLVLILTVGCDGALPAADAGLDLRELDTDADGISDWHEGRADERDTDADGTPDYLDDDSDGDTIFDAIEGLRDSDDDRRRRWHRRPARGRRRGGLHPARRQRWRRHRGLS